MSSVKPEDLKKLLAFILQTEKQSHKENPMPTAEERRIKIRDYSKKVEEITEDIAKRGGLYNEN